VYSPEKASSCAVEDGVDWRGVSAGAAAASGKARSVEKRKAKQRATKATRRWVKAGNLQKA
jgi:hypothetical protein